ncbi:uncharacterized protein LOC141686437 [Apium graveolens]|uniref:uncharacterized protein LOC141686437 n=1 Tax=Apium graveolens TaxID=4045 RepID=UPI003D78C692
MDLYVSLDADLVPSLDNEKKGAIMQSAAWLNLEGLRPIICNCLWDKSRGKYNWVQECLDRGLATRQWLDLFPSPEVRVLEVAMSDHLPLHLQLNKQIYRRKDRRFRFENIWLRKSECENVVKQGWNDTEGLDIIEKINYCSLKLQEWGGGISNDFKQQARDLRDRLRKLRSRRDSNGIQLYNEICLDKKKTNVLQRIKNMEGAWRESTEEIQVVIEDYFTELFSSSVLNGKLSEREEIKKISDEDNMEHMAEVTIEEVKAAVFSMHPDKSPGPDGLNPVFFQSFWTVVGPDVVKFCRNYMSTGILPDGINIGLPDSKGESSSDYGGYSSNFTL